MWQRTSSTAIQTYIALPSSASKYVRCKPRRLFPVWSRSVIGFNQFLFRSRASCFVPQLSKTTIFTTLHVGDTTQRRAAESNMSIAKFYRDRVDNGSAVVAMTTGSMGCPDAGNVRRARYAEAFSASSSSGSAASSVPGEVDWTHGGNARLGQGTPEHMMLQWRHISKTIYAWNFRCRREQLRPCLDHPSAVVPSGN
jgi:hypothetical protein